MCMCLLVFALYTLYLLFITEVHLIWHSEIVVFKCIFFYFCLYARKENTSIKLFIFFRVCLHFLLCLLPTFLFNVSAFFLHFKVIPYRRKKTINYFFRLRVFFVVCGFVVVVVACNWLLFACFTSYLEN